MASTLNFIAIFVVLIQIPVELTPFIKNKRGKKGNETGRSRKRLKKPN